MTPNEYIQNPMGKGSAVVPNADVKNKLNLEFEKVRYKMSVNCYLMDSHLAVYCFLIPSTSSTEVNYNVVLQFDLTQSDERGVLTTADLPFLCYSNCPSFVFTYARAFADKGLLIPWIKSKYSKDSLKESKVRNTYGIISYEKSLYIALRYLVRSPLANVNQFKVVAKKVKTPREIKSIVADFDTIMNQYNTKPKEKIELNKKRNILTQAELDSIKRRDEALAKHKVLPVKKVSKVKKIRKI